MHRLFKKTSATVETAGTECDSPARAKTEPPDSPEKRPTQRLATEVLGLSDMLLHDDKLFGFESLTLSNPGVGFDNMYNSLVQRGEIIVVKQDESSFNVQELRPPRSGFGGGKDSEQSKGSSGQNGSELGVKNGGNNRDTGSTQKSGTHYYQHANTLPTSGMNFKQTNEQKAHPVRAGTYTPPSLPRGQDSKKPPNRLSEKDQEPVSRTMKHVMQAGTIHSVSESTVQKDTSTLLHEEMPEDFSGREYYGQDNQLDLSVANSVMQSRFFGISPGETIDAFTGVFGVNKFEEGKADLFSQEADKGPSLLKMEVKNFAEKEAKSIESLLTQASKGGSSFSAWLTPNMVGITEKIFASAVANSNESPNQSSGPIQTQISQFQKVHAESPLLHDEDEKVGVCQLHQLDLSAVPKKDLLAVNTMAISSQEKSGRTFLLGLESSTILECNLGVKTSVKRHSMSASVSTVCVSADEKYFAAGTSQGEVLIKKIDSSLAKKIITLQEKEAVEHMEFIAHRILLVSTSKYVYSLAIKNFKVMLDVTQKVVLSKQKESIIQISSLILPTKTLIAICFQSSIQVFNTNTTEETLSLQMLGDTIVNETMMKLPANNQLPPCVAWVADKLSNYLLVFWSTSILLYKVQAAAKDVPASLELRSKTDYSQPIVWACVLDARFIGLMTDSTDVEFMSMDHVVNNVNRQDNVYSKLQLHSGVAITSKQSTLINSLKSKLLDEMVPIASKIELFKLFRQRMYCTGDEIFATTADGLVRYKLANFYTMVDTAAKGTNLIAAIKLVNKIFLNRIHASLHEKEAISKIVPNLVHQYWKRSLNQTLDEEEINLVLAVIIECLMYSNNVDYAFELEKEGAFGSERFWKQLGNLIRQGRVKRLPAKYLKQGCDHLDSLDLANLLKHIVKKSADSLADPDTELCLLGDVAFIVREKHLWPFFYQLCLMEPENSTSVMMDLLLGEALKEKAAEPNDTPPSLMRLYWMVQVVSVPGQLAAIVATLGVSCPTTSDQFTIIIAEWLLSPVTVRKLSPLNIHLFLDALSKIASSSFILNHVNLRKLSGSSNYKAQQIAGPIKATPETIFRHVLGSISPEHSTSVAMMVLALPGTRDIEWLGQCLVMVVSKPYSPELLYIDLKPVDKDTVEDLMVKTMSRLRQATDQSFSGMLLASVRENAFKNK